MIFPTSQQELEGTLVFYDMNKDEFILWIERQGSNVRTLVGHSKIIDEFEETIGLFESIADIRLLVIEEHVEQYGHVFVLFLEA